MPSSPSVSFCSRFGLGFLVLSSALLAEQTLYKADFSSAPPAPLFERFPKMEAVEGVLRVSNERRHAASPTLPIPFQEGELAFRFRVVKGAGFTCRFEDEARVADTNAHLCRVEVLGKEVRLLVDQPPQDKERREKAMLARVEGSFADGQWHEIRLRFAGESFSAVLDGKARLEGRHEHFSGKKIGAFFVVRKAVVELDDLVLTSTDPKLPPKAVEPKKSAGVDARGMGLFHDYIEPLLKTHCYECHSHEAKKAKGGLVLDSLNPMLKGGDLGPALKPGDPAGSLLYQAVLYHDEDLQMPPEGKLSAEDIAHLREWIERGAPHPRTGPEIAAGAPSGPRAEALWSVKPLQKAAPPKLPQDQWSRSEVDRFLFAAMQEKNLTPSSDAPPHVLLRRLHEVLTGLPPTAEEVRAFVSEAGQDVEKAIAAKIDSLMQTRHFGERWGRHWLDVARYADTSGATSPRAFREAWRYREYVIDAFHSDKPWDRFVREQIAGDVLPFENEDEKVAAQVATGFLALSHVLAVDRDPEKLKLDVMDEQLDVIGRSFLGVQVGCARCHDHKIDPFPTRDYYALAGIFRSSETLKGLSDGEALVPSGAALPERPDASASWLSGGKNTRLHSATEATKMRDEPIHLRGESTVLGEVVPRGFPTLVSLQTAAIPPQQSGRAQLADWLLHEDNALTARVIVNRVWQHVFGQGLVRTADNFGFTGDLPSHPALLDHLARRFRHEHGFHFKSFIRELLLTRAFRQSSIARAEAMAVDPQNRLLWRSNLRRRDAEALIDSLRAVAGSLDLEAAGFTTPKFGNNNQLSTANLDIPAEVLAKRAIYWPVFRKDVPVAMDILGLFDFPPATLPRGTRSITQVPSQSLALLNSPMVISAAKALSQSVESLPDAERLRQIHLRLFAREATSAEVETLLSFVRTFEKDLVTTQAAKPANASGVAWTRLCHTLLVSNEFIVLP